MKNNIFLIVIGIAILTFSCKHNKLDIDISSIKVETKIKRFDKDIYHVNIDSIDEYVLFLQNKYGNFFDLYNYKIIKIGGVKDKNYPEYFISFLTDYTVNEIMKATEKEYENDKDINKELNAAFKHYKYYFPKKNIPQLFTFVAGFNQSIVIDSNILAIGLDKYLGINTDIYTFMQIPEYKKRNMHREKIVSDCMKALAMSEYEFNDSADNLLNHMIYEGKIMYFIDAMIPDEPDNLKIGYTQDQLEWCLKYEKDIWTYLIENKILYSTEYMQIKRYIDDAPFTPSFSKKSPGRIGIWVGLQIVRSYMKNHPEINIEKLMNKNNYQEILNHSSYRP